MNTILFYGDSEEVFGALQKVTGSEKHEIITAADDESFIRFMSDRGADCCVLQKRTAAIDFEYIKRQQQNDARLSVLLIPYDEELSAVRSFAEENGIFTVPKALFVEHADTVFSLLDSFQSKLSELNREKEKLSHKLIENRLVDRAKCILIQHLKLTELQAHKYIERRAMDLRMSREKVAQIILQTYEQS